VELQIKNLPHTGVKVLKQEDHPGRWWPFYSFAPIVTTRGDPTLFVGQATARDAVVASLSRCGRAAANEVANPPITLMKSRRRTTLKTEKTDTIVTLPILPVLAETLAAGPCGDLTFIAGESGNPLTKESFGNLFRDACRAAGVPGSAHGVRKIAATRAANAGATVAQLEAIFGWQGGSMAALYTRAADRRRLSIEAMSKLGNDRRTSIVAPLYEVRHLGEKEK
jgi:hypothetical protein